MRADVDATYDVCERMSSRFENLCFRTLDVGVDQIDDLVIREERRERDRGNLLKVPVLAPTTCPQSTEPALAAAGLADICRLYLLAIPVSWISDVKLDLPFGSRHSSSNQPCLPEV